MIRIREFLPVVDVAVVVVVAVVAVVVVAVASAVAPLPRITTAKTTHSPDKPLSRRSHENPSQQRHFWLLGKLCYNQLLLSKIGYNLHQLATATQWG